MPRRLLITGSRNWDNHARLMVAVVNQWVKWKRPKDAILVSGACPKGADNMAEAVWDELDLEIEFHPADWKRHGKQAGFIRNKEMVDLGADVCLAFLAPCVDIRCKITEPHSSHGATHTFDLANKAGIRTRMYRL